MTFDLRLRSFLERLGQGPDEHKRALRQIDEHALKSHLLELLRADQRSESMVTALFTEWSPRLGRLARYIEALPPQLVPTDPGGALAFARKALTHAIRGSESSVPAVDRLELQRIVEEFGLLDGKMKTYALENRLIRREPGGQRLTRLGGVFLQLRGKESVRWLLTVEVSQSRGDRDPWRASRDLLEALMSEGGVIQESADHDGPPPPFPFDTETLERLCRLGVVDSHQLGAYVDRYDVERAMRDVVQAVLDPGPWHAAVAALLEDERAAILPAPGPGATEATIEQTRMIAHEVRNALIPVRHHIDELLGAAAEPPERERMFAARRGVVRVLAFVDDLVATSELVDEPPTSCDVGEVVNEALGWPDGGERVEMDPVEEPVRVRAPRLRLVRAVSYVVANALQATTAAQRVRVSVVRSGRMVEICVDDGGPGVPEESRERIFLDGFTTRPGGSGYGLAFVRTLIEGRLQGKVWCEASDLGGARLVIAIPETVER